MAEIALKWRNIIENSAARIMLLLFGLLIGLTTLFLAYTYQSQLNQHEDAEKSKLSSIAHTLAAQIDGDEHTALFESFAEMDALKKTDDHPFYLQNQKMLANAKNANGLKTDIYTMVLNPSRKYFEFAISSSTNPYWKHQWSEFDAVHIEKYNSGGDLGPYTDENGTWLSSFAPIKNKAGQTVGLLQVDQTFDTFIVAARNAVIRQLGFVLVGLAVVAFFILRQVRKILNKEDALKQELSEKSKELALKNRDIVDSINAAQRIQSATLPVIANIKKVFPEMFVMFQPRDIVSGDFFWFMEKDEYSYFAVADCTGHGVPGAFMSLIGNTILTNIINSDDSITPGMVLTKLNNQITSSINRNTKHEGEGMDIALCRFNKSTGELLFSGAGRPLTQLSNRELSIFKGDKHSIGSKYFAKQAFTDHEIPCTAGDLIYLYSDGFADQFGGEKGKKYLSKRFQDFIIDHQDLRLEDQQYLFQYEFHFWKGELEQIDDVLIGAFRIPNTAINQQLKVA